MRIWIKPAVRKWLLGITLILVLILLPWKISAWRYARQIFLPELAPSRWLAIVLGAGLRRDGSPSSVLADRVSVAAELYHQGKVSKILMSGSARNPDHSEPAAMRKLAIHLGVQADDILTDSGGSRTYETCRRARQIFEVKHAMLISQRFHLPRALGICEALGIDAIGVSADLHDYGPLTIKFWELREIPATIAAYWDSYIAPVMERCASRIQTSPYPNLKGNDDET
jgi:SanA protein